MPITKEVIVLYTDDGIGNSIGEIVEEVVRCKDCTWFDRDDDTGTECPVIESGGYPKWDGYCAWGERREDECKRDA